jgi:hypothetical protein
MSQHLLLVDPWRMNLYSLVLITGFIWGVRFAEVVSEWNYVENGKRAKFWSDTIGCKIHEVSVETNAYRLDIVFENFRYSFLGYEPEIAIKKDYPLQVNEITSDGGVS